MDWTALWTFVAAMAACAAVWVAYKQLDNLNTTLRMNGLMTVLQIEAEMNARKLRVDELVFEIRKEEIKSNSKKDLIEILGDQLKGCLENWFNSADRFAFCILKGYLPEADWKVEYRHYFATLVQNHEEHFRANTIYHNIVDLNAKWHRE